MARAEDGAAHQRSVGVLQDGPGVRMAQVRLGGRFLLRLGKGGEAVGFLAASQEPGQINQLCRRQFGQDQRIHGRTLTRYGDRVSRPRTPKGRARVVSARLAEEFPGSARELCALQHENPFQLLAATILSAQCTDVRVNQVTPVLFAAYPEAADLARANPEDVEEIIRTTGFFRAKTRNLIGMAGAVVERFDGEVPTALSDLVTLPGVGRKTGNVVRSVAFGLPGLPVDTHVLRLARRLGLTQEEDPVKVEHELNALVPAADRGAFSLRMILHGRATCVARRPACGRCVLGDICPSFAP
jgi:endonuclease III